MIRNKPPLTYFIHCLNNLMQLYTHNFITNRLLDLLLWDIGLHFIVLHHKGKVEKHSREMLQEGIGCIQIYFLSENKVRNETTSRLTSRPSKDGKLNLCKVYILNRGRQVLPWASLFASMFLHNIRNSSKIFHFLFRLYDFENSTSRRNEEKWRQSFCFYKGNLSLLSVSASGKRETSNSIFS